MSDLAKILLVEDDQNFGDVLCTFLELKDYDVTWVTDGNAGWQTFNKGDFDLCILDVMMPKKDGFTLAQEIREKDDKTPIIFLTAKAMKEDVINGFKIGADDYIAKPFDTKDLLYRVQAVLRRSMNAQDKPKEDVKEFTIGKYHFNFPLRLLTIGDHTDKLSPKEAQLLQLFCLYMNDILPRSVALKKIWEEDNYFTARSMDVFVTKLRKYLKKDESIEIVNIHGNGFQLVVRETEA